MSFFDASQAAWQTADGGAPPVYRDLGQFFDAAAPDPVMRCVAFAPTREAPSMVALSAKAPVVAPPAAPLRLEREHFRSSLPADALLARLTAAADAVEASYSVDAARFKLSAECVCDEHHEVVAFVGRVFSSQTRSGADLVAEFQCRRGSPGAWAAVWTAMGLVVSASAPAAAASAAPFVAPGDGLSLAARVPDALREMAASSCPLQRLEAARLLARSPQCKGVRSVVTDALGAVDARDAAEAEAVLCAAVGRCSAPVDAELGAALSRLARSAQNDLVRAEAARALQQAN